MAFEPKLLIYLLKSTFPHLNPKGHDIDDASTSERPSKNSRKVCDGICRKSRQLLVVFFFQICRRILSILENIYVSRVSNYGARKCCCGNEFKPKKVAVKSIVLITLDNKWTLVSIILKDSYITNATQRAQRVQRMQERSLRSRVRITL